MHISWNAVSARLSGARIYWLAMVDRKGAPLTIPSWGVVVDDALYFYVNGATGTALNLRRNPHVAINLEDGENPVLVRGTVKSAGGPADLPELVAAFAEKYDDRQDSRFPNPTPEPADLIYVVTPSWALLTDNTESKAAYRPRRFELDPRIQIWTPAEAVDTRDL